MAYLNGRKIFLNPVVTLDAFDYEEGTWTPTLVQTGQEPYGEMQSSDCHCWKINDLAIVQGQFKVLNYEVEYDLNTFTFDGLPFNFATSFETPLRFSFVSSANETKSGVGITAGSVFALNLDCNLAANEGFTVDFTIVGAIHDNSSNEN